jgi:hypothetical protein
LRFREGGWRSLRLKYALVILLSLSVITYCLLISYFIGNTEFAKNVPLIILVIFNLLFVSIIFQLNGSLDLKFGILAFGNFVGVCWNYFFINFFKDFGSLPFMQTAVGVNIFKVTYVVLLPFLNVLWFVVFWSLSLTVFSKFTQGKVEFSS